MRQQIEQHYLENHDRLVKIMTNRAGTVQDAEDVVHSAYELALKYRNSFDSDLRPLGAWFNTILNNALRLHKRKEKMMGMSLEYDEELDEGNTLLEWEHDTIKAVKADIEKKPFPLRQALYLYFFKQYKPREIAQVLDLTNGYIRKRVTWFRSEMQEKYGGMV